MSTTPGAVPKVGTRRQQHDPADDRGSIIMVLLLIIMASILVVTVAGIAISQQAIAQRTVQRNDALEAAEAGLDAAVGQLRAANNGAGNGEPEQLPCTGTDGFSLTGYLDTTSTATYTVTVSYWQSVEPTNTNISAGKAETISCYTAVSPGYPEAVPYYALIESIGKDKATSAASPPNRTIEEIYAFHDTNLNVADGVIEDFNYAVDDLCIADLTAWNTNSTPAAGDELGVEKCATAGDPYQTWQYDQNFTLEFTSTSTSSTPLCVQSNTTSDTIELADCASPVTSSQQWGINDLGEYEPVSSTGGPASQDVCINEAANSAGSALNLAACDSSGFSDEQTWQPTPAVGSGDAGIATQQFVNYDEFGNCMDVTNQSVSSTYLIDYMCKQFPDGVKWSPSSGTNPYDPSWNQRFQQVSVTYAGNNESYEELVTNDQPANNPNTLYCLYSPDNITDGTTGPTGNNPSWVTVATCPTLQSGKMPVGDQNFLWTVNSSTTYNVTDYWANCLTADTADQQVPGGGSSFSTITVAQCTGAAAQEWNAPATLSYSGVSNMFEPNVSGN